MTKEELLKPRYKVIADYPTSDYKIGDILFYNERLSTLSYSKTLTHYDKWIRVENYPAIFKKLEWWEGREEKDMPEYVVDKESPSVMYRVFGWRDNNDQFYISEDKLYFAWTKFFNPATKEEYEHSIKLTHRM